MQITLDRTVTSYTVHGTKLRFVKCHFNHQGKIMERGFSRNKRIKKTDLKLTSSIDKSVRSKCLHFFNPFFYPLIQR